MSTTVNTESTAVHFNQQGETYLSQGKLEEAIASCEQALKIHPSFAPAYKTLGNALQAQGRMEEARHWYAKAIEIEPNFAEVYANLGSICAQQQKWQEAIAHYQKAIAIKPNFAGVYRNLAKVFGEVGKPAEAQECWYRAFSLEPEKAKPSEHLGMGDAFARQERLPEAIACYDRAIKFDPSLTQAYQNMGEALKKQGKLEEATVYYRKAIELNAANARNGSEGQQTLAGANGANGAVKPPQVQPEVAPQVQQPQVQPQIPEQILRKIPPEILQQIPEQIRQQIQPQVQPPANPGISTEDPEAYKILAEGYFAQGKMEQAISACKKALQIKPEAPLYKMLGNALQVGGKIDEAKTCYVRAIEINPNFAEAYANYGSICAQQEEWQEAISAYEKAIALKPDFAGAFRNYAKLLTQLGKSEEATQCWYRAFAIDPKSGTAEDLENLAKTLIEQGKVNQGIDCYRRAVELNPNAGAAYHELAEILKGQEQWESAVDAYTKAIQINPDLSWSHNNLAESLVKLERWDEAVDAYRRAIELNPDFSWSHNNLADVLLKLERWDEAVEPYQKATELNPDFSWSHNYLADALIKLERWDEAIAAYRRSIELNPDHFWAHNNLAEALVNLERWDEAVAAYQRANELNPNFFWSHSKLGDVLLEMERWEDAVVVYRRAAELNRDFAWTYYNMGTAFEKLERWDESIASYRCAAEIQPDLPWLSQKLADALRMRSQWDLQDAMGLYRRAIDHNPDDVQLYHKALEISPNDAGLYVELANALGRKGWVDGAIVFYQMALQIRPGDRAISAGLEEVLEKKGVVRSAGGDRAVNGNSGSAIEQNPGVATEYHELGESLGQEGKFKEAVAAYRKAIAINPNYFGTHHNLGDILRLLGKVDEAIKSYRKAAELNPSFVWSYHNLGDVFQQENRFDEAVVSYRKAIEVDPNFGWSHYNLAKTLAKQDQLSEALEEYQIASKLDPKLFGLDYQNLRDSLFLGQDPAYTKWRAKHSPRDSDLRKMAETLEIFNYKPLISIVMPAYNTPENYLQEAIESVLNQIYPYWELCIADDASTAPHVKRILKEYAAKDSRIKVAYRTKNGHISHCSNSALELATGEFISLLDHDDTLTPEALYEVVLLLNRHPEADMIYSDEDKIYQDKELINPFFKAEWSPDSFLSRMYTCHLGTYRRKLINEIGGFRVGFEGAQDYDLVLRFTEKTDKIFHIPKILYHWRMHAGSAAGGVDAKPYAYDAGQKALQEAIERRGEPGRIEGVPEFLGHFIARYKIADYKRVSIIIPTKDLGDVLNTCLESIFTKSVYPNYEVIVIDNGSKEKHTAEILAKWESLESARFKSYHLDIPFNFSKINNYAASKAEGDYLLFLNNDTEVITPDWIDAMVEQAQRSSIGAVGNLLIYSDNKIQHAGVVMGLGGGVAGHSYYHMPRSIPGYFGNVVGMNNVSAVTAACLMCRREVFESVGGFDEELTVAYNDVDLCLKMLEKGYRNIYLPHVVLYHHESKSRGYEDSPEKKQRLKKESKLMESKWQKYIDNDPYYSPHLTRACQDSGIRLEDENWRPTN
ncbi:glycosyl transferase family 2 [Tychonema bourrellyi FEM_GT703]|uniref:Glycosyl transferase family 2 n=1 Tax=Tychonema bourrellyi FEM_GT703 TaxID=2040638 RepID=A0A2G4F6S5_9CYAN|nr:tetratricopeptide repeat protein [Tychonema bourrellyi]PHX57425.1 glycosyl transferase family 2 [Tychonema bourrellyi FEM_GT703]